MSNTCCDCSKKITGTRFRGIQCTGTCKNFFHLKCITISGNIAESLEIGSIIWVCPKCKANNQSAIDVANGNSTKLSNTSDGSSTGSATIDDVQMGINNLSIRFGGLENSQRFISDSMEALRNDLKNALEEVKSLKMQIKKTDDECCSLRQRINLLESLNDLPVQEKLLTNIVITGIPINNHNNKELIMKVLSFVQPEISNTDVLEVNKVNIEAKKFKTKVTTEIYIVKLASSDIKNGIINSMKNFKNFTADNLGITFTTNLRSRIFIMQHLSQFQSKLYNEAKIIKREHNFRFLWIRNGVIMLRHHESSQVFHIRSYSNIDQIKKTIQQEK